MYKYGVAALWIAVAIGPASALDVGIGAKVGGIGVGADVGAGKKGAAVGIDTKVGGLAGAKAGASVGKKRDRSLDAKVGAKADVGGVAGVKGGASAGVGNGSVGVSAGVSGNVGRAVGVDAGTSVSAGNGSVSANLGANANIGDTRAGVSAGVDTQGRSSSGGGGAGSGNTTGGSIAGSKSSGIGGMRAAAARDASIGSNGGDTTADIGPTKGVHAIALPRALVRYSIILPPILRPSGAGRAKSGRGAWGYPLGSLAPIVAKPGTPRAVVRACRQAIVSVATPLGAVRVYAASAGPLHRQRRGAVTAPIEVRIHYATQGGVEVRQARTQCQLDAAGRVIALK